MEQVALPGAPPNFRGAAGIQVRDCWPPGPGPYLGHHHTLFCLLFALYILDWRVYCELAQDLSFSPKYAALVPGARPGLGQGISSAERG